MVQFTRQYGSVYIDLDPCSKQQPVKLDNWFTLMSRHFGQRCVTKCVPLFVWYVDLPNDMSQYWVNIKTVKVCPGHCGENKL